MHWRLIFVALLIIFSCEEQESDDSSYYFMYPNSYYMVADGENELVLNVMENHITLDRFHNISKVESEIKFFHNGQPLTGNTFNTSHKGEHKFHATYNGWKSDEITVIARPPKDYELISIPLIFHVLYDDEPIGQGANISSQDIEHIVLAINQRFRNTYYSLNYPEVIQSPNHVDTMIEFRLAQYDPEGSLLDEPGIERYGGYKATTWTNTEPQGRFLTEYMWPPYQYINISVSNHPGINGSSVPQSDYEHQFCGAGGRTDETWEEYFERNSQGGANVVFQGIIMSLTSIYAHRTLTHELGHTLGLWHPFDWDCNTNRFPFGLNDCIDDTQFYNELEYVTPQKSLSKIFYECTTNYLVTHDNYMDYYRSSEPETFDTYYGFTYDQRDRMREILEYSPWIKELKYSTK